MSEGEQVRACGGPRARSLCQGLGATGGRTVRETGLSSGSGTKDNGLLEESSGSQLDLVAARGMG